MLASGSALADSWTVGLVGGSQAVRDYWISDSQGWIRVHVSPRRGLFRPQQVVGGPALETLSGNRLTLLTLTDRSLFSSFFHCDLGANGLVDLGSEWVGMSIFPVRGSKLRSSEQFWANIQPETREQIEKTADQDQKFGNFIGQLDLGDMIPEPEERIISSITQGSQVSQ